jgi:hypothetical protein
MLFSLHTSVVHSLSQEDHQRLELGHVLLQHGDAGILERITRKFQAIRPQAVDFDLECLVVPGTEEVCARGSAGVARGAQTRGLSASTMAEEDGTSRSRGWPYPASRSHALISANV